MGLVSYQMFINPCRQMAFNFTKITGLTSCTNLYTTKDFRPLGKQSLLENKSPVLKGGGKKFILEFSQNFLHNMMFAAYSLVFR